jgi:hypothetical protein
MKIVFKSVYDDGKKALNPGDVAEIDDTEALRIISVGGARAQTDAEVAAELEAKVDADKKLAEEAAAKAAAKSGGKNPQ